jgi:preprotein translocase subunit YajC
MWNFSKAGSDLCLDVLVRQVLLFAQEASGAEAATKPEGTNSILVFLFENPLVFMMIAFLLFWFIVVLPQQRSVRKQQQEAKEALDNLRKNDRVVTSGGIHGSVVNVSTETGTVTIRIDEATNAKMTVNREAISKIFREESKS